MNDSIIELARLVGQQLQRHQLKMATAESCTGGGIAYALTAIAGSSAWFDRGFVTYSNHAKIQQLGVPEETLEHFGAVSEQTVLEMAKGTITHSQAHLSVAVSGIAGPDGGTADKPVGTVWIAWGQKLGYAEARCFHFDGDRQQVRDQAITAALEGIVARLN